MAKTVNKTKAAFRLFLESDILQRNELTSAQFTVESTWEDMGYSIRFPDNIFDHVQDMAWHDLENTWLLVKKATEIYASSSLIPLVGNAYMGAPVIMDAMCQKAIEENVTGKKVFLLVPLSSVYWHSVDLKLVKKAFKKGINDLYTLEDKEDGKQYFKRVSIHQLKK